MAPTEQTGQGQVHVPSRTQLRMELYQYRIIYRILADVILKEADNGEDDCPETGPFGALTTRSRLVYYLQLV